MDLNYVLEDEKGNAGQSIDLTQSEIKTIKVFWFKSNGVPYAPLAITELLVKVFKGALITPLAKSLGDNTVSLISGNGGYIGFEFTMSASDTATLPISSTVGMSAIVINSTTGEDKLDLPNAFNVAAQLVS